MTTQAPAAGAAPLVVRTVAVPDPGPLLGLLPDSRGLAWLRRGEGLVGWGHAARVRVGGPDRFAAAEDWWSALVRTAVVRDAFCADEQSPTGVYLGTRDGCLYASADEGDTFTLVADHLPDVLAVRAVRLP